MCLILPWIAALFLLPFLHSTASSSVASINACHQLQQSLGTTIVQNSTGPIYRNGTTNPWNSFNMQYQPTCIVFPEVARHVQIAMREIFHAGSKYAVQAGGHSAVKGWNNIDDGVLIIFIHMKGVSYNPSRDTITLEPGASWGDALVTLEAQGVAPMGGRVSIVGIGGLLLGGGLNFASAAHGFSADTYKEVDVVLVTGQLVTATVDNEYSDLFRALKGGANRFGIVVRYEVKAIHTGTNEDKNWFGGTVMWDISRGNQVMDALAHYVRDVNDPKSALLLYVASLPIAGVLNSFIIANIFYNGDVTDLPEDVYGELLSIPTTSMDLSKLSYMEIAHYLVDANVPKGQLFGASAFGTIEQPYRDAFSSFMNFSQTFQTSYESTLIAFTPVLVSQIIAGRQSGGNAIDPPLGGYNALQFQVTFPVGVESVPPELEAGRQIFFRQSPPSPGLPLYINECDETQDVFATYGQYEWLKQTYLKYDPTRYNVRHTKGPKGL